MVRRDMKYASASLTVLNLSMLINMAHKQINLGENQMSKSIDQTRAIVQSMIALSAAALGLVCALAWNDAIKSAMKAILGEDDSLVGLFTYAIMATVVAVFVLIVLARVAAKVGGEAAVSREAEG